MDYLVDMQDGYVLIITLILVIIFLSLGMFLLDHFLVSQKVLQNLYLELRTYYLAQGGLEIAEYRLKANPNWRTLETKVSLGINGSIRLVVVDENELIHVESTGFYQTSKKQSHAYFTKAIPISRIK